MQSSLQSNTHRRHRGQALVEFGLVIMLFVLLVSGVFDFGMLLNTRLGVSSLSRELARAAASGATSQQLDTLANDPSNHIAGVTAGPFGGQYFSSDGTAAAVVATMTIYDRNMGFLASRLPQPGDYAAGYFVGVQVTAKGAEVITPLIRPIFGCDGAQQYCTVGGIQATTIMRLEPNVVPTPGP